MTAPPSTIAERYAEAVRERAEGRRERAETLCRSILELEPEHPDALHLLGLLAADAGDRGRASSLLRRAIARHGTNPDLHANLGLILEHRGELDEAIAASRRAIELRPQHFAAWFNLGNQCRGLGRLTEAIDAYRAAVAIDADHAPVQSNLGAALEAAGEHAAAVEAYRRAIAIGPEQAEMHSNLGIALQSLGRFDEASAAYQRSLALDPTFVDAHTNLAAALLQQGKPAAALEAIEACQRLERTNRTALALEGIARNQLGDRAEAARLLDFDRLLRARVLETPQGFASLEAFNAALAEHALEHPTLVYEPEGKSTRQGSQTRNLLAADKGPVATLEAEIEAAVNDYFASLPADPEHPFLAWQPARWRLNVWATVLDAQGHQAPHIHPAGWLSGVYYVRIPESADEPGSQAGWIEFGCAPDALAGHAEPIVERIQPRAGTMLLFPSYFYHRTIPFEAGPKRISIAFDVLPENEPPPAHRERALRSEIERVRGLLRANRLAEADEACQRLLATAPQAADAWHLRGLIANRQARFAAGAELIGRAIEAGPQRAAYHIDHATALRQLRRYDEALEAYRRAIELAPDDPGMHVALATLLTDLGRFEESAAAYEHAIAIRPQHGQAHYGLAFLKRFRADDPQIATMEASLADAKDLQELERALLHFALGRAYDDLGEYGRAFPHFAEGNRLKRRRTVFDLSLEEANARRIMSAFSEALFARLKGVGCPSELPVFVVGMPRSGTTLVEQILASHPQVHGGGELNDLWRTVAQLAPYLPPGRKLPEAVGEVDPQGWRVLGEAYAQTLSGYAPDAARVTDKMPFNYTLLGIVRLMLPNARIIHCARDPMDTCLSCYFTSFAADRGFTYDLGELGGAYRIYRDLMRHWQEVLPGGMFEICYEDLVADVEGCARPLVEYLGLPWADACLDYHSNARVVDTASHVQVRRPAYQTSVDRWRHYEQYLAPLRHALAGHRE